MGFEPTNGGFAIRSLSPLGHAAERDLTYRLTYFVGIGWALVRIDRTAPLQPIFGAGSVPSAVRIPDPHTGIRTLPIPGIGYHKPDNCYRIQVRLNGKIVGE